jgi:hypothetical protein
VPGYRTQIIVSGDRYVCLQLPDHFPEGEATVTVVGSHPSPAESPEVDPTVLRHDQPDEDIEWWEEFDDDSESRGRDDGT